MKILAFDTTIKNAILFLIKDNIFLVGEIYFHYNKDSSAKVELAN